jgi:hypothetical protein
VVLPSHTFGSGLVFDSRVYTPLTDVSPVVSTDSGATGMQHMAVIKNFSIAYTVTNYITVPPPVLVFDSSNIVRWEGVSNLAYTVQARTNFNFTNWITLGTASSVNTNFSFTNPTAVSQEFFRVTYP